MTTAHTANKHRKSIDPLLPTTKHSDAKQTDFVELDCYTCITGNRCLCNILLFPLTLITYPLIYLLDGPSCWHSRRYQQHDLAFQFVGVFQNLVAVFWSNSLVSMIEYLLNEQSLNLKDTHLTLLITFSYAFIMYFLSMILIAIVAKLPFLSDRITFFVGLFVRIIAFGVKDLFFMIQDIYFSNPFKRAFAFFFLQLFVAILVLVSLSSIRSCLCSGQFKKKNTANESDRERKYGASQSRKEKYDKLHEKRMAKKKRHQELYAKRMHNKLREKNFNELINQLDVDIWAISLGFCLVEVVIYGLARQWIPLESSVVHEKGVQDLAALHFLYLFLSLCVLWVIWLNAIAWFQMVRDRAYQKVFLMANYVFVGASNIDQYYDDYIIQYTNLLWQSSDFDGAKTNGQQRGQKHDSKTQADIELSMSATLSRHGNISHILFPKRISPNPNVRNLDTQSNDGNSSTNVSNPNTSSSASTPPQFQSLDGNTSSFQNLSCGYRFLFYSGFKYKNAMDRFVAFMDGILGWSMGWSLAGAVFIDYHWHYRLMYASIASVACILTEICRNYYIHRNINSWYAVSKKRRRLYKQTMDDIEHKALSMDIKYYQDTVDMRDESEREKQRQKLLEDKRKLDVFKREVIMAASTVLPEEEEVDDSEQHTDLEVQSEIHSDLQINPNAVENGGSLKKEERVHSLVSVGGYGLDSGMISFQPQTYPMKSGCVLDDVHSELASSINSGHVYQYQRVSTQSNAAETRPRAHSTKKTLAEYIKHRTSNVAANRQESTNTYLSSNLDIADPRKRHINLGIMSNNEHKAVYIYNHISVTWRKTIGLVMAIVWSATVASLLDPRSDVHVSFRYNVISMAAITILATYLGMRFTDIKTKYTGYSNADITKRFIQAYHQDVLETRQYIATKFQLD